MDCSFKRGTVRLTEGVEPDWDEVTARLDFVREVCGVPVCFQRARREGDSWVVPFLSARDNIELPVRFDGSRPDSATISELLDLLDITDCEKSMPSELSGGQQQRVAIARALVSRPAVVLADEPTGSLDRANGEKVVGLLSKVREHFDTTIVLVTHDESVAASADRIVRISDGRVVDREG